MRDVNTLWKMKSGWMSDKWLSKVVIAEAQVSMMGNPQEAPTTWVSQGSGRWEPQYTTREMRGRIRDTPDSLSCSPMKKESLFPGESSPRGTRLRDTRQSKGRGLGTELETEGLQKDSILKDEIPQPLILAQLPEHKLRSLPLSPFTLLQPALGRRIHDSSLYKVPGQREKTIDTDNGVHQRNCQALSGLFYNRIQLGKSCPCTQNFQQPRNGLQGSPSLEWKPLALKMETPT